MIDISGKTTRELRSLFTALEWDLYRRKGIMPDGYTNTDPPDRKEPVKRSPVKSPNEAQKLFRSAVLPREGVPLDWGRANAENLFCPYPATGNPPVQLPFKDGFARCIEVDFPWNYQDRNYNGFADVQAYRIHPNYDVMPMYDIWQMGHEIRRIANPNGCHLWVWSTKDFYLQARAMIEAWGWLFKQEPPWIKTTDGLNPGHVGLEEFTQAELDACLRVMATWGQYGKPAFGMGRWMRNLVEPLIFATNDNAHKLANAANEPALIMDKVPGGEPDPRRPACSCDNRGRAMSCEACAPLDQGVIFDPTGGHSAKPPSAYELIRRNSPAPRVSLFCREKRKGFLPWGNEVRPASIERNGHG